MGLAPGLVAIQIRRDHEADPIGQPEDYWFVTSPYPKRLGIRADHAQFFQSKYTLRPFPSFSINFTACMAKNVFINRIALQISMLGIPFRIFVSDRINDFR